jgi:reactive intermediate/imine deaminase
MTTRKIVSALILIALAVVPAAAQRKYIPHPTPADAKPLPFSDAVLMGNTLFISGHIGLDPKTNLAPADPEEEAKLVMEGIKKTVESAGLTMDDMVSVQVFCTDLKYYDTFNAVYKTYFKDNYPARAFIGTDKLLRNGKYEVMGIAVRRPQ